jgi:hypothetical protein
MSDLEHLGIERLKAASDMSLQHYGQPLVITDSGGKDSSVLRRMEACGLRGMSYGKQEPGTGIYTLAPVQTALHQCF